MSATGEVQGLCNYYARTGYYRHIQTVCNEFLKKKPNADPALVFWRAYGAMREGSINEAIRDLDSIKREGELLFPVVLALLHAHNLSKIVDADEVRRLEAALTKEQGRTGERGLLMAAQFAWHADRLEDAREYVERLLALKPSSTQGVILKSWIELSSGGAADLEPDAWGEAAAQGGPARRELEALMGKAKQAEVLGQHGKALENLNQVIVHYAWFLPALAEKAKVLMASNDWEQAVETAQRLLSLDPHNIEGLRISALSLLSQEGKYATAQQRISDLIDAVDRHEPKNAPLYDALARPLARVAGRQPQILRATLSLAERACRLAPFHAGYAVERAYQLTLLGDFGAAAAAYREAHALDESDTSALLGQIRCQVEAGQLAEAAAQLEFIAAIQEAVGATAELAFVSALVAARHERDKAGAVAHLDEALRLQMATLHAKGAPGGPPPHAAAGSFLARFNADFLLELAREYVGHVGDEPEVLEERSVEAGAIAKALKLLEIIRRTCPGILEAQMLLARAKYLHGDNEGALHLLAHCNRVDPAYAPASLLHAQILLRQGQPKAAHSVLEAALAHNFEIRNSILFHLVHAHSLAADSDGAGGKVSDGLSEALAVLRGALKLPGVREGGPPVPKGAAAPSAHERCSVYLQLVETLLRAGQLEEGGKVMGEAIAAFAGTEQEGRITVANCELLLQKGDVSGALAILRAVPPTSPNYYRARALLADLYLKYRNDRRLYCLCFEEMAKASPSVSTYIALGEAYMNVQEPQKAIPAFERALERSPADATLACRIGKALVSTHDYVRAIEYYTRSISNDPAKAVLKYELASLYVRLQKWELAQETLEELLEGAAAVTGSAGEPPPPRRDGAGEAHVQELMRDAKAWVMLARVLRQRGQAAQAMAALMKAKEVQQAVVTAVVTDAPDAVAEQRAALAEIALALAELHGAAHDSDAALGCYLDALKQTPKSTAATLALARLYLQRGEVEQCHHQCVSLIKLDADNADASLMLADLAVQRAAGGKADYDAVLFHFHQLLEKEPAHFVALHKLLLLLRHSGRLRDARPLLERARAAHATASKRAGLHFCAGTLARFEANAHEALAQLNGARRDGEWGERAAISMAEVYIGADTLIDWADESGEGAAAQGEPQMDNLHAADRLLRELRPSSKQRVLASLVTIAQRGRANAEAAVARLLEELQADQDYMPALVAVSIGYLTLGQAPKARNHLKRVAKMAYQPEFADDFELGWLLLAHVYIQAGKFDIAEELCTRALSANKSCARAYELLGMVKEKELSYRDAASAYEQAWRLEQEAGATVGFKLAFNLLKAKQYVDAIDVCHKVLKAYPDYPRIQKDILEKARLSLRA